MSTRAAAGEHTRARARARPAFAQIRCAAATCRSLAITAVCAFSAVAFAAPPTPAAPAPSPPSPSVTRIPPREPPTLADEVGGRSAAGPRTHTPERGACRDPRVAVHTPTQAELRLTAYLDADQDSALETWIMVLTVHARVADRVALAIVWVPPQPNRRMAGEDLHRWLLAASDVDPLTVLRELARARALARVDVRSADGRARLGERLDLDASTIQTIERRLDGREPRACGTAPGATPPVLSFSPTQVGLGALSPPVMELSHGARVLDLVAYDANDSSPRPDSLTIALERNLRDLRRPTQRRPADPLGRQSTATARAQLPAGALRLGGPGLPHTLSLLASGEDDGVLPYFLADAMAYRSRHPGTLTVDVVAQGSGPAAATLARRSCAARALGRALDYARYLARSVSLRGGRSDRDLLEALDGVDTCKTAASVRAPAAYGAWLDGRPLDYDEGGANLGRSIMLSDRSAGLMDLLWTK